MNKVIFIIFAFILNCQSWAAQISVKKTMERQAIQKVVAQMPSGVTFVKSFTQKSKVMLPMVAALNIVHISFVQIPKIVGKNLLALAIKMRSDFLVSFLMPLVLSQEEVAKIKVNLKNLQEA